MNPATMDLISKPIELVVLLLLLLCTRPVGLQLRRGRDDYSSTVFRCTEEERDALLDFKSGLVDPGNRLSSWVVVEDDDCCQWRGVRCNNRTGHVERLLLGGPQGRFGYGDSTKMLGGEIRPSLLALTHLKHLDLSLNDFSVMTGGIPVFLGSLKELRYLNLSVARFMGRVPPELGNLSTIRHLNLSNNILLEVEDTRWLSRLTSLRHLDMSSVSFLNASSSNWLHALNMLPSILEIRLSGCELDLPSSLPHHNNFTSLSILDLRSNNINSTIPEWLGSLTSLSLLDLSFNQFYGHIPAALGNMISLEHLDLMFNQFDGPIPAALGNMTSLEFLGLSFTGYIHAREISKSLVNLCNLSTFRLSGLGVSGYLNDLQDVVFSAGCMRNNLNTLELVETNLTGSLPDWLGGLRNLRILHIFGNQLYGSIPASLGNLVYLQSLDLSDNKLNGSVPMTLGLLSNLTDLSLRSNNLEGILPDWLGGLINLVYLDMSSNQLYGSIPASLENLVSLQSLYLTNNKLNGLVPMTLGLLSNLTSLGLGNNNLEGFISEAHFMNLAKLSYIDISGNPLLALRVSSDWNPPFRLHYISMGSCQLGHQFPAWVRTQENYSELNMSNAGISDTMPDWFWNISTQVYILDLSHNKIDGKVQSLNSEYVQVLDLSHNLFSGPIPPSMGEAMPNLEYLYLSTNWINDTVPLSICKATQLTALDLSNNFLSGELPKCLENLPFLTVLDLSNNGLSRELPRSICTLSNLQSLHLGSNNLSGEVPFAFSNWTNLVALDLSNNRFNGSIIPPGIVQSLSSLMFLSLHSNLLSGSIPSQLSNLHELQVLDLSHNQLSGFIPQSFGDFNAMKFDHKINYTFISILQYTQENMMLNMKGRYLLYDWRLLSIVVTFDLSNNQLSGSVPKELGNLIGLETLDLSGNQLSGEIIDFGEMQQLERLDLSKNKFSGRIPSSLSTLYSLNHLNLSYNNLTGRIPSGEQLQTLDDPSIYIGNDDLCGPPLMKKCPDDEAPPTAEDGFNTEEETEESNEILWIFSGMAPGFVAGLSALFGLLVLKREWRIAYFRFIDNTYDRFYVAIVVNMNKLKREMRKIGNHGLTRRN